MIKIRDRLIGPGQPCFIIAEAGVNHVLEKEDLEKINLKSPLEVAYKMVDVVKESGADAIKFQSFSATELQIKDTKKPKYQVNKYKNISYYDLIKKLETSKEDQKKIANYCKKKGVIFLSTPYDNKSVDFLDSELNVPIFKLASIELTNHLFLRYVAKKGKPLIISTGLSTLMDVKKVINISRREHFSDRIVLLQCTSNYPTLPKDIHLNVLKTYKKEFPGILIGLSDHSPSDTASLGAVVLGASVVEKHFTLNKNFKGPDHHASLDIAELKNWVKHIREIEDSLGSYEKKVVSVEKDNEAMKKFLVITPQKKGTLIQEHMLKAMRTGRGIAPLEENLNKIIGKRLKRDIKELTILTWDLIK